MDKDMQLEVIQTALRSLHARVVAQSCFGPILLEVDF